MNFRNWLGLAAGLTLLGAAPATANPTVHMDVDPAEALEVLVVEPVELLGLPATPEQPFEVDVIIEGELHTLLLGSWNLRTENFQAYTIGDDGVLTPFEADAPLTVRGSSLQDPRIVVAGSLLPDGLKVTITRVGPDQITWGLQPMRTIDPNADRSAHVVYRADETTASGFCGNDNHNHLEDAVQGDNFGAFDDRTLLLTEIAHDADFNYYQLNNSNEQNVIADIENVMATVTATYERDSEVTFGSTAFVIRTSAAADPYSSTSAQTLLNQFRTEWLTNQSSIQRDIAHLWTGRSIQGSTIGIAFTIGGICTSSSYCLSQARFTGNFAARVALVAHEIGHIYGAFHCNQNPFVSSPCNIMCAGLGGCNGLGLPNFGPQSIDFIVNHAASRSCLDEIPDNLAPPIVDNFDAGGPLDPFIWETFSAVSPNTLAQNEPSADRSLLMFGGGSASSVLSTFLAGDPIYVGLWAAANGASTGDAVVFEYLNTSTSQFEELIRWEATENNQTDALFEYKVAQLPPASFSDQARFRIRNTGTGQWFADSLRIGDVTVAGLPFNDPIDGAAPSGAHWDSLTLVNVQSGRFEVSAFEIINSLPIQGDYWLNDSRPLFISFDVEQSGLPAGMQLIAEVSDGSGGFDPVVTVTAGGAGVSGPETVQGEIPAANQLANMQVRLRATGPIAPGTFFNVDNFLIGDARTVEPPACVGDIADDFGALGSPDGQVSFGDFLAALTLLGPCPGGTPGCTADIADDFGTVNGGDGQVSFGDFLGLLTLLGPCP